MALHYACNDLLQDNCDMAIAGGVNLMFTAHAHEMFGQAGALSPDGMCRTFDSAANGMVPGEGGGVVILKRLARALADGDRIDAVIAASAINNDGKSIGIMAPAPEGQQKVLRRAYAKAGVSPAQVSYVEAHGTGTVLGDQIEMRALTRVFGTEGGATECAIGSVKSGIGHLLAAAGVAGLLKVVLALRHQQLPPSVHFQASHARLRLDASPFRPVSCLTAWPAAALPRYAGVSAFGFGGTNAHVVVRDQPAPARAAPASRPRLLCLSARNAAELTLMRHALHAHLARHPELGLADVCYTQSAGRKSFGHRWCALVDDSRKAGAQLLEDAAGGAGGKAPALALVCHPATRQGLAGARALYAQHADYASAFDACAASVARRYPHWPALADSLLAHAGAALPAPWRRAAQFAADFALARLWTGVGITPAKIFASGADLPLAACIAGAIGIDDALMLCTWEAQQEPSFERLCATLELNRPAHALVVMPSAHVNAHAALLSRLATVGPAPVAGPRGAEPALVYLHLGDASAVEHWRAQDSTRARLHALASLASAAAPDAPVFLSSVATLWMLGCAIDWPALYRGADARIVELPSYPLQRARYGLPQPLSRPALVA